jgi:hypothetical protein
MVLPGHPFTADDYAPPWQVERYDIKLRPVVWSVEPGHWLQLTLTTQEPMSTVPAS